MYLHLYLHLYLNLYAYNKHKWCHLTPDLCHRLQTFGLSHRGGRSCTVSHLHLTSSLWIFLLAALYFTYSFTRTATSVSDRIFKFVFVIGGTSLLLGFISFLFALLCQFLHICHSYSFSFVKHFCSIFAQVISGEKPIWEEAPGGDVWPPLSAGAVTVEYVRLHNATAQKSRGFFPFYYRAIVEMLLERWIHIEPTQKQASGKYLWIYRKKWCDEWM